MAIFPLSVNNVEAAEKAIKDTLSSIAENGIPEEHIAKAKQLAQMDLVKAFSTNASLCGSFAYLMMTDKPLGYSMRYDLSVFSLSLKKRSASD